jgi:hypothetical protein
VYLCEALSRSKGTRLTSHTTRNRRIVNAQRDMPRTAVDAALTYASSQAAIAAKMKIRRVWTTASGVIHGLPVQMAELEGSFAFVDI